MMHNPSWEQEVVVDASSNSNPYKSDVFLKEIHSLLEPLSQSLRYIDEHRDGFTIDHIKKNHKEWHLKPLKDKQQHCELMPHNDISVTYGNRVSQEDIERFQDLHCFTSTLLRNLAYLSLWQETSSKRLKKIFFNQSMQSGISGQVVQPSNFHTSPGVLDYLRQDLLPYWGEIVKLFIFESLNTSVAQAKIHVKKAKKKSEIVRKTIESIYSPDYIQNCEACFRTKVREVMDDRGACKNDHSLIKVIKKLKKSTLEPIQKMHSKLSILIDKIEYGDRPNLQEKVISSLKMFYNIAYSFVIIDLIATFGQLVSIIEDFQEKEEANLKKIGIRELQLCAARLHLANFIQGDRKLDFDALNKRFRELLIPPKIC